MSEEKRRLGGQVEGGVTHQLTLVEREHLTLDGARNVVGFSPEEILLETSAGAMAIKGEDLRIQQLNLDEGRVVVHGSFISLTYAGEGFGQKGRHFLGRLLR